MKKMIIIPFTEEFEKESGSRIHWTYLHGKLEREVGFDVYGVLNYVGETDADGSLKPIADGLYPCTFKDKDCTLYYWNSSSNRGRGLVVYNDDEEGMKYAKKLYSSKTDLI